MKLDKDLVREILLAIEADTTDPKKGIDLKIEKLSPQIISYHVELLTEAGFLVSRDHAYLFESVSIWRPARLTYKGHEFIETLRDEEVWGRTRKGAEKVGSAGLGLLFEFGKAYLKEVVKERTGIDLP